MSQVRDNSSYYQAQTNFGKKLVENNPGKRISKGLPKVANRSGSTDTVTTEPEEPFNKWSNIDTSPPTFEKKYTETITSKQGKQLGRQWRSSATMLTADQGVVDHAKQKEIAIMAKNIVSRRKGSEDTVEDDIEAQIKAEMEEEKAANLKKQWERETSLPSPISYQRAQPDTYVGWGRLSEVDPITKPIKNLGGFNFVKTVRKAHEGKTGFLPAIWEYKNEDGLKVYVRAIGIQEAVCRDANNCMVAPVVQCLRNGINGWPKLVAEFTAGSATYVMIPKTGDLKGPWFA